MTDDGHIATSSTERLVYMANQIGKFFASQKHDAAVAGTASHIAQFWDPRMRKMIFAYLNAGGKGLEPITREALQQLAAKQKA